MAKKIKIGKRNVKVPVVSEMELAGQEFEIELFPTPGKEQGEILSEYRKTKFVMNPKTAKMEAVIYFEADKEKNDRYEAAANDLLDKIVVNFHGIEDMDGKDLDGTIKANKILLGSIVIEDTEDIVIEADDNMDRAVIKQKRIRPFRALIFDKAAKLAETMAEAVEKNSASSPVNTAAASE